MNESRRYALRKAPPPVEEIEAEARTVFADESEPLVNVWRYWRTLRKHLRLALAVTLAAVGLTALHTTTETPIYTAETMIQLQPSLPQSSGSLENLVEIEAEVANSDQYYTTQCTILQSRNLAIDVIRDLGLQHHAVFAGKPSKPGTLAQLWSNLRGGAKALPTRKEDTPLPDPPLPEGAAGVPLSLVHAYLGMLKITPVQNTNLVKVSFATPDPRLSAQLADAHVRAYEREQVQMHGQQSDEAQHFLQNKLVEIKEQLEKSEAALNDYRRKKGIIPGLISLDGKDAVVLDRLSDLSKDLTLAQVERIGLESQVQLITKHQYASLPAVMQNATIQELDKELNGLYAENAALSSQFKSDYPQLKKLQAKIHEEQGRVTAEIDKVVGGIRSEYEQALGKEGKLQAEMDRQRTETLNLNDAAAQYAILQRDVDTNRQLYNAVLTRLKDVAVTSGSGSTNVSIINSAEVPGAPTSPNKARELMTALVMGLSGGVALAFLLEFLDDTLKNPEEAENYLRVPSLGVVPDFASLNGNGRSSYLSYGTRRLIGARPEAALKQGDELVTSQAAYSSLGEAYRNLRTALMLSRAGAPPKVTLITSAMSGEGKTVTAVNMAATLAQLGAATLLIDADLRRSRCHRVLAMDNDLGLTEVLTGSQQLHDVVQETQVQNLDFLSSGSVPPNPTELLGSKKMIETLKRLAGVYEYIVVDSSPILPVSDSLILAQLVDGVMIVADGAATSRQHVKVACARIQYARGKILGLVLNRIKIHSPDYYLYHHQYYHYQNEDSQGGGEPT